MQIDWFTVIAQAVNFIILLLLLKHFLFDRIASAIDKRQENMAQQFEKAEEKNKKADEELENYRNKNKKLEKEKEEILNQAREDARQKRQEMLEEARGEIGSRKRAWAEALEKRQEHFLKELRRQLGEQIFTISRRVLDDVIDRDMESAVVSIFLERLHSLDEKRQKAFAESTEGQTDGMIVRTSFELEPADKKRITETLRSEIAGDMKTKYEINSDMICGISIEANGRRVSWSIEDYLSGLEDRISEKLEEMEPTLHEESELSGKSPEDEESKK